LNPKGQTTRRIFNNDRIDICLRPPEQVFVGLGGTGQHTQLQDDRHGKAAKGAFKLHILLSFFRRDPSGWVQTTQALRPVSCHYEIPGPKRQII